MKHRYIIHNKYNFTMGLLQWLCCLMSIFFDRHLGLAIVFFIVGTMFIIDGISRVEK